MINQQPKKLFLQRLSSRFQYFHVFRKTMSERPTHLRQNSDSTCPLCRNPLQDASHHWVLPATDCPSADQMPALVLGLVDRAEGRTSTASISSCDQFVGENAENDLVTSSTSDGFTLISHKDSEDEIH